MNKSRHVTFRCTQKQYDAIKEQAKANGDSISAFIVERCTRDDSITYLTPEERSFLNEEINKRYSAIQDQLYDSLKDKP